MAMQRNTQYDKYLLGADERCWFTTDCTETQLNNNVMVEGGSGSGKTLSTLLPILLHSGYNNSIVVLTKKGLLLQVKKWMEMHGFDVAVLDFTDIASSQYGYDPFDYCRTPSDVQDMARSIVFSNDAALGAGKPKDPLWDNSAQQLIDLVLRFVWEGHYPGGRRLIDAVKLLDHIHAWDDEQFARPDVGDQTFVSEAEARKERAQRRGRGEVLHRSYRWSDCNEPWDESDKHRHPLHYTLRNLQHINPADFAVWQRFNEGADQTSASIASTVSSHIAKFFNNDIRTILGKKTSYQLSRMLQPKQVLFIYMSPVNMAQHTFISLVYHQLFKNLFEMGERQADGMLPYPVQVLCDDFATGCRIPDFDKTISIFREKRISAVMLVQSETQLASMYGQMAAKTIINNCDTLVYLGGMDIDTCSSIARRANVPMEDVTTMKVGQEIYFRRGMKPVFTQRYDVTADNAYIQSHGSAR